MLPAMVRDLRYVVGAPYWETLLVLDRLNRGSCDLQDEIKEGPSPEEVVATWREIRDPVERHMRALAPGLALHSPSERALSILQQGLRQVLLYGDFTPSQRDRIEMLLSQARREHLGAEAVAA